MARVEDEGAVYVPVVAETLRVSRRLVETGAVRVHKRVQVHDEVVDEPRFREEVHIERVACDRILDQPATARFEGDVLVLPVQEEVLVIERRVRLVEELRITRLKTVERARQRVTLRREVVEIERASAKQEKGV